jgi:hypothetical protein
MLKTYAKEGSTFILLTGWFCSTDQLPMTIAYLDEALRQGMQAIVGLSCKDNTPTIPAPQFVSVINVLKNHPALYAYYLADEPEWNTSQSALKRHHTSLASDPGYYQLVKTNDPNHPVFISFNMFYNQKQWNTAKKFFDVTDIVGIHAYPTMADESPWQGEIRSMYDIWKTGQEDALAGGKQEFIATCMGFGSIEVYREPTYEEARYQVFTAVVLGIKKVLFWMDEWGESTNYKHRVTQLIGQIQAIGSEMNAGNTNDPRIGVSVTDRNRLVYRYGASGYRHVILAINIAKRTRTTGATLSDVRFTIPTSIKASQVTVLNENRTLQITNHSFVDNFQPFAVHIYAINDHLNSFPSYIATSTPGTSDFSFQETENFFNLLLKPFHSSPMIPEYKK